MLSRGKWMASFLLLEAVVLFLVPARATAAPRAGGGGSAPRPPMMTSPAFHPGQGNNAGMHSMSSGHGNTSAWGQHGSSLNPYSGNGGSGRMGQPGSMANLAASFHMPAGAGLGHNSLVGSGSTASSTRAPGNTASAFRFPGGALGWNHSGLNSMMTGNNSSSNAPGHGVQLRLATPGQRAQSLCGNGFEHRRRIQHDATWPEFEYGGQYSFHPWPEWSRFVFDI